MNIWDTLVYLFRGLRGIGFIFLTFIIWALFARARTQDDAELERERMMRDGN